MVKEKYRCKHVSICEIICSFLDINRDILTIIICVIGNQSPRSVQSRPFHCICSSC